MTSTPNRCRFAPSPTGPLHLGSLIAALGSFLEARRLDAQWLVRIEDIDTLRVVPGSADLILRSLQLYGMQWDGPVTFQSQRSPLYRSALYRLRQSGLVYPCSCSRREISATAVLAASGYVYPGTCRDGARNPQRPLAERLRTGQQGLGTVTFDDRVQGVFRQNLPTDVGDFVIRRADGIYAYHLAVVVDDAEQGISHVVRGSDLLDSTPRHIYLQRLLGYSSPDFCHLPIAIDSEGHKLSKQTGAQPLPLDDPSPTLCLALKLLGQSPPAELTGSSVSRLWEWALAHWDLRKVPRRLAI